MMPDRESSVQQSRLTQELTERTGFTIYERSVTQLQNVTLALGRKGSSKSLFVLGANGALDNPALRPLLGAQTPFDGERTLSERPMGEIDAGHLRDLLPLTRPQTLGLATSAGFGDRLGLATPGHIQALRDTGIAGIFAQQSMRENARTGRTPTQVMDDATWGVFQEGWREPWGADADHLKTTEHIDWCVEAGYTFFTIDPGEHVDNEAHVAPPARLQEIWEALPWDSLETTPGDLRSRYLKRQFAIGDGLTLGFEPETLARAAGKYGRAIAHTARMYRHLAGLTGQFELEMSVDETETVTSEEEHFFVASELQRLGVKWVSLAPRYVGEFEKGVDYIGDLDVFAASLSKHAAIARHLGPYKLSIHSGSDKFSIYPIFAELTGGLVPLKTAGTSYLEALRAIASIDPALFRRILFLAAERYPTDRATYHVSASLDRIPDPATIADPDLGVYLDQFDAREILHVTFGSALDAYSREILDVLRENEDVYYEMLERHFDRHLQPFASG
ncbi:MAG: hypothetical protein J5I90_05535 [Caldilineales bacterium]|nr:hypothetical protein [Caldilineales bacterium]